MARVQAKPVSSDDQWETVLDPTQGPQLPQSPTAAISEFLKQPVQNTDDEWSTVAVPLYHQTELGKAQIVNGMLQGEDFSVPVGALDAQPVYSQGPSSAPDPSVHGSLKASDAIDSDLSHRFQVNKQEANQVNSLGRIVAQQIARPISEAGNDATNAKLAGMEQQFQNMRPWYQAKDPVQALTELLTGTAGTVVGSLEDPSSLIGGAGKNIVDTAIRGGVSNMVADIPTQIANIFGGIQKEYNPNAEQYDPTTDEYTPTLDAQGNPIPVMQTREYDPVQTAVAGLTGAALPVGLEAIVNPQARKEIAALFNAGLERIRSLGARTGKVNTGPATPEETDIIMRDPQIQAVLEASGQANSPRADEFADRIAQRQAADAARAPQTDVSEVTPAQVFAELERQRQLKEQGQSGDINAAFVPPTSPRDVPPAFTVDSRGTARQADIATREPVTPVGQPQTRVQPQVEPGLERAAEGTAQKLLPAPGRAQTNPMTDAEIAIASRQMAQSPEETTSRLFQGDTTREEPSAPGRLLGGEDRQPGTPAAIEGQRQAKGAFTLADRQRERLAAGEPPSSVRDTQAAGLPKGIQPQAVLLHEGHPVRILHEQTMKNAAGEDVSIATVKRYDPRTGEDAPDSIEYMIDRRKLKQKNYTPEPRRAQEFAERAKGPTTPEYPRAADGPVAREPKQTFRSTTPDPNEQFPAAGEGRSPLPPQPERTEPPRYSSAEEAVRDYNNRQSNYNERANQKQREERAQERYKEAKTSNTPKAPDKDKRWHVDEDGYVISTKGGPIKFADQVQAARWIINEGQRKSPDQNFELTNHPTSDGFSARETSRTPKQEPPKDKGLGDEAPRGASGERSKESFDKEAGTAQEAQPSKLLGGDEQPRNADTPKSADEVRPDSEKTGHQSSENAADRNGAEKPEAAPKADKSSAAKEDPFDIKPEEVAAAFETRLRAARTPKKFGSILSQVDQGFSDAEARAIARQLGIKVPAAATAAEVLEKLKAEVKFGKGKNTGENIFRSGAAMTPEETKGFIKAMRNLIFGGSEEWAQHFAENAKIFGHVPGPGESFKRIWRGTTAVARTAFFSADGRVRAMARQLKSKTMVEVADMFHAPAGGKVDGIIFKQPGGTKRTVETTYEEAVADKVTRAMNDLSGAFEHFFDKPEALEQITKLVQSGGGDPKTAIGRAAAEIRRMLKDEHKYLTDAGVEMGEVKGGTYFPREFDHMEIMRNPAAFKSAVEKEYRQLGSDAATAKAQAEALLDSVLLGGDGAGIFRGGNSGNRPAFTAGRVFGKGADARLRQFYLQDPVRVLSNYFNRAARRAEAARRFGDKWEKWVELEHKIREEVGPKDASHAVDAARALAMASTGMRTTALNPNLIVASSWIRTVTGLSLLSKVTISSLQELVMPGVRAGSMFESFKSLVKAGSEAGLMIGGKKSDAIAAAEDLGIIFSHYGQSIHSARYFGDDPGSVFLQKATRSYFRNVGLEQVTNITRALAGSSAQTFVRRMVLSAADSEVGKIHLRELGIPDEKMAGFSKWLSSFENHMPDASDLKPKPGGKFEDNVRMYRTAIQRFVNQSVQNPTGATKPSWASHPLGAILFQLNSFNMAFAKNVLGRTVRRGREVILNKDLTAIERAHMAIQTVAPFLLLNAIGVAISIQRDRAYGYKREEKDSDEDPALFGLTTQGDFVQGVRHMSRVGDFGAADPWVNYFTQARYDSDPITALSGPGIGTIAGVVGLAQEFATKNSDETNTTERKAARMFYDNFLEPGANLLLNTTMPPNLISAAATQYLGASSTREKFVNSVAGEDDREDEGDKTSSAAPAPSKAPVQVAQDDTSRKGRKYAVSKGADGKTLVEVLEG